MCYNEVSSIRCPAECGKSTFDIGKKKTGGMLGWTLLKLLKLWSA